MNAEQLQALANQLRASADEKEKSQSAGPSTGRANVRDDKPAAWGLGDLTMQEVGDTANQMARMVSQGATFGFGDEMAAGGDATLDYLFGGGDQSWRQSYDQNLARERGHMDQFREANPSLAMVSEIAGALPTALATSGMSIAPAAVRAGTWPGSRALAALTGAGRKSKVAPNMVRPSYLWRSTKGTAGGGASGAVYGYGQGEGDEGSRAESAILPALFGGAGGFVAPALGSVARGVGEKVARGRVARRAGVPRKTVDTLMEAADMDTAHGARGLTVHEGGVMAEAGPAMRSVLDRSIQRTGSAAAPARRFADERATQEVSRAEEVLDEVLGTPRGMRSVSGQLRAESAPARRFAYDTAYDTPIDYRSEIGMRLKNLVEGPLSRVPPEVLRKAQRMMRIEGVRNRNTPAAEQALLRFGDDGRFLGWERMPDVRELDYIKRALDDWARVGEGAGAMGGRTNESRIYQDLARDVRDLTAEAVPAYRLALDVAGDTIRNQKAMELGATALRTRVTVDEFADEMSNISDAERQYVAQGIRDYIDNVMDQAKQSYTPQLTASGHIARAVRHDPDVLKGIRELSSKANRQKIAMVVGDEEAARLFNQIDEASAAMELKDSILANLRKSARSITDEQLALSEAGAAAQFQRGEPVGAAKTFVAELAGAGPEARTAATSSLDEALINTLLSEVQSDQLTALAQSQRPSVSGMEAGRLMEVLFGRGKLAAIPTLPQQQDRR